MEIYYTACIDNKEMGSLYQEWTGRAYSDEYMLWNSSFCVARDKDAGSKVVGCIQLIVISDPFFQRTWGLIENVFVTEKYRRRGIGKGLMKFMETRAQMFGCEFIKLTTRKPSGVEMYRSLGYEEATSFRKQLR